ncbi:nitroreductase/quinone reductase family protein [Streptomyces durmitorensis]|uniref:Nitroreductase/quinone reductase family protein n=1 Tax=Streptomyces durmitorensis TaxID=319947 RepID=A0ABY4Q3V5_9ACTN|nr:nitroreductase/quinone reductase family protein [Streptomyces durmitorensis]UQT60397.1 nitroreductase/quinone reductase family protein [Streptomyces durmitorensis]
MPEEPEQPAQLPSPAEFNRQLMADFRANGGQVGGMFAGAPLVLLTTTGARSGHPRSNPAVYARDGDRLLVFASNGGGDKNPDWYHNLLADPRLTVEIADGTGGVDRFPATAEPLAGEERDRQYAAQCERDPAFAAYQQGTDRTIPVIALHRLNAADPARHRAIADHLVRVHAELRDELADLRKQAAARQTASGTPRPAPPLGEQLTRHCLTLCGALHEHHTNEDGAFTELERQFPELAPGIARLREEHKTVARTLAELEALIADPDPAADLVGELDRLTSGLEEHFAYEEEQLLPALYGRGR